MSKLPDWHERLITYLLKVRNERLVHSWGDFSCAKFAGGAIEAQTGVDPHAPFEGKYSTAKEATQLLKDEGFYNFPAWIKAYAPEIPVVQAQFGDIILTSVEVELLNVDPSDIPEEVRYMVGVSEPPIYWVMTEAGIARALLIGPGSQMKKAFRVS